VFEVELLFQAEDELSEAYDWYEERQTGLGNRLFREVNHYLGVIEKNPFHFQIRYPQSLRAAPLKIFPYLVIYWIDESKRVVYVTSIFHTSRDPELL
jgi:toxin ParE1/3/4